MFSLKEVRDYRYTLKKRWLDNYIVFTINGARKTHNTFWNFDLIEPPKAWNPNIASSGTLTGRISSC